MAASAAMAQDGSMAHMGQGTMQDMAPAAASSRMGSMHQGMMRHNMGPAGASSSMHPMRQGMMRQGMMRKSMHTSNGSMHRMPATVTSVDAKSGKVGVDAGGMALTVQFPPQSMASLKVGDKITLHMGYTQ